MIAPAAVVRETPALAVPLMLTVANLRKTYGAAEVVRGVHSSATSIPISLCSRT